MTGSFDHESSVQYSIDGGFGFGSTKYSELVSDHGIYKAILFVTVEDSFRSNIIELLRVQGKVQQGKGVSQKNPT